MRSRAALAGFNGTAGGVSRPAGTCEPDSRKGSKMTRLATVAAWVAVALAGLGQPLAADELDELARRLGLRPQWYGYKAKLHYEQKTFEFPGPKGPTRQVLRVIQDGDKYVALVSDDHVQLLAFTPPMASARLSLREGRYHLDNLRGPTIETGAFLPDRKTRYRTRGPAVPQTDHFRGGGTKLSLVRAAHVGRTQVLHQYDFYVHEVFGYMVEGSTTVTLRPSRSKRPTKPEVAVFSIFCPNSYVPWPTRWVYDCTVFCPGGSSGYLAWPNHSVAIARAGTAKEPFTLRDGGFVAYLDPQTGWSPCRTLTDACPPATISVDQRNQVHLSVTLPEDLATDDANRPTYKATHRLFGLPPAVSQHLRQNMKMASLGAGGVVLRVGQPEDFESQPVALAEPVRGLAWTGEAPALTTLEAHGGKKSLVLRGTWPVNDPAISFHPDACEVPLRPNAKYRLEAWLRVEGMTPEQRRAYREAYDDMAAKLQAENAKITDEKRKKRIPSYHAPKQYAEAYLTGHLYETTPKEGRWAVRQLTNVVNSSKIEWQQVALEFTTPAWDPYIYISFVVDSGHAFLDDFCLKRID